MTRRTTWYLGMALATLIGLAAASAQGALVVDLRLADGGGTSLMLTPSMANTDIHVQAWAVVTGADLIHTNDALQYLFYSVKSTPTGGGAMSTGGITVSTIMAPFRDLGSQLGKIQELTIPPDGVKDVGSNEPKPVADDVKPRAASAVWGGGATGKAYGDKGWQWMVQEMTFHIGDLIPGLGVTTLSVTVPTSTIAPKGANWWEDTIFKTGGNTGAYGVGGTGVALIMPEPATLALLGVGGLALVLRRRRTR